MPVEQRPQLGYELGFGQQQRGQGFPVVNNQRIENLVAGTEIWRDMKAQRGRSTEAGFRKTLHTAVVTLTADARTAELDTHGILFQHGAIHRLDANPHAVPPLPPHLVHYCSLPFFKKMKLTKSTPVVDSTFDGRPLQ